MNAWESIFLQSPANNGRYEEDDLPQSNWNWPKKTWFRTRLDYVRDREPLMSLKFHRKLGLRVEVRLA